MGEDGFTTNARAREAAAVWVELDQVTPWEDNPRRNAHAVPKVIESLIELGWGRPLVARKDGGELVVGHTARLAALELAQRWAADRDDRKKAARWHPDAIRTAETGMVPVRFVELSARKAHQLALADNRLGEKSEWDTELLQKVMSEFDNAELELAGWDSDDLEKMADELLDGAGGDLDEPAEDDSERAKTDFAVLIECADEQEQLHIISKLEEMGIRCRALT